MPRPTSERTLKELPLWLLLLNVLISCIMPVRLSVRPHLLSVRPSWMMIWFSLPRRTSSLLTEFLGLSSSRAGYATSLVRWSEGARHLGQNHLKVNLDKWVFGNREVSYLGFLLTPEGIKPGRNKLQAIWDAQPPTNIKMVRSFVDLCNFFRTCIKDFAIIAAPLFRVTRKDSGYKNGPLPPDALQAFKVLQQQLTSDPEMAFPRSDRQYALITDAATGTANFAGGLGAILTQVDNNGNHYAISFASRQLKDHE